MKAYYQQGEFKLEVTPVSRRTSFGRKEVMIIPVSGSGTKWVWDDKVTYVDEEEIKKKTVKK